MSRLALIATALVALLGAAGIATAATPATITYGFYDPQGPPLTIVHGTVSWASSPGVGNADITSAGGTLRHQKVFCVDVSHPVTPGTTFTNVELQTAADAPELSSAAYQQVAWLISAYQAAGLPGTSLPTAGEEAAATQVAIWEVLGQVDGTDNAAINARAAFLVQSSAGKALASLALSAGTPTRSGTSSDVSVNVTITGTPGAKVDLAVSAPARLSVAQVTLDGGGRGSVTVTAASPGSATLSATADRGGALTRITRIGANADGPQNTAWVESGAQSASLPLSFPGVDVVISGQTPSSPTAVVPAGGQSGTRLAIRKLGPARALAGSTVVYTIKVTNVGARTARQVVVRDALPSEMSLANRSATLKLRSGGLSSSLGNLAPGASRTVQVRVRIDVGATGTRRNTAIASAANAATVRAAAKTQIVPVKVARAVRPAVTG